MTGNFFTSIFPGPVRFGAESWKPGRTPACRILDELTAWKTVTRLSKAELCRNQPGSMFGAEAACRMASVAFGATGERVYEVFGVAGFEARPHGSALT